MLCGWRNKILDSLFEDEAHLESDNMDWVKKDTDSGFFRPPDVYRGEEIDDLDDYFLRCTIQFRRSLVEEVEPIKFFKSFRSILDMENFSEHRNTYTFWRDYIRQLWDQSGQAEKEKIWLALNDLLNYVSNPL